MAFGINFIPDENGDDQQNGPAGSSPESRYQSAVKILNLRLPRVLGGQGLAPSPLLNAPGAMGQRQVVMGGQPVNSAIAQAFLQMAGMGQPPMGGAPMPPPMARPPMMRPQSASIGTPRVIPGIAGPPMGKDPTYPGFQPGEVDPGPSAPGWLAPPDYPAPTPKPPLRKAGRGDDYWSNPGGILG